VLHADLGRVSIWLFVPLSAATSPAAIEQATPDLALAAHLGAEKDALRL